MQAKCSAWTWVLIRSFLSVERGQTDQNKEMNLIYFTDGKSLNDGDVRRQALRIPEVLTAIRAEQPSDSASGDVLSEMLLDDQFNKLCPVRRTQLCRVVQNAIFERFCRTRTPYTEMIFRRDFRSASAVAKELNWQARTGEPVVVYVIGPGLDEVPLMAKNPKIEFVDVIDADPGLQWFWPALQKAANA